MLWFFAIAGWGQIASAANLAIEQIEGGEAVLVQWQGAGILQVSSNLADWSAVRTNGNSHRVEIASGPTRYFRVANHLSADTVLRNAVIYPVSIEGPILGSLAIREGRIVYVGEGDASGWIDDQTTVIDVGNRVVMPGFQDSHLHLVEAGINESLATLPRVGNELAYRLGLRSALISQPGGERDWVTGAGVNIAALRDSVESPLALIDELISDRPAVMLDDLGHGAWVNSVALELAGIGPESDDPQGGIIDRDVVTGELTGIVLENIAQSFIDLAQFPTQENLDQTYQAFLEILPVLSRNGITTVSDAGGYWPRGHHEIWKRAEQAGQLTVRANNAFYVYPNKPLAEQVEELKKLRRDVAGNLVRFDQVKLYVDGIISQGTAALFEPYEEQVGLSADENRGFLYFGEALNRYAEAFVEAGFQLHFHAVGDWATRLALDAISQTRTRVTTEMRSHRITHLYLVNSLDVPRFKELGVFADFQLALSSLSRENLLDAEFFIGSRVEDYLPARTLLDAGASLTLSSDFDADRLSPFEKIESVVSRPNQGIPDVATAVRLMTLEPARLLQHDKETGSLDVGKWADLIVLSQDIHSTPIHRIGETRVLLTLLGGKPVFHTFPF